MVRVRCSLAKLSCNASSGLSRSGVWCAHSISSIILLKLNQVDKTVTMLIGTLVKISEILYAQHFCHTPRTVLVLQRDMDTRALL